MLLAAGADGLLVEAQQVEGEEHTQERGFRRIELLHAKPVGGEIVRQLRNALLDASPLVVHAPQFHRLFFAVGHEYSIGVAGHLDELVPTAL